MGFSGLGTSAMLLPSAQKGMGFSPFLSFIRRGLGTKNGSF